MRFGIFYEHQMPRPWAENAEEKLLTDALDQVELADKVGIDYVWEVEHHFLEEYSHSSAPEVFLAAASQRTKNIRLGHGIVQIPPGFNHPARVAERIGDARPDLRRARRVRHRGVELADGARRLRRRPRRQAGAVGGGRRRDHPHVRGGAVRRLRRALHLDAAALGGAEAQAEAAPAAVGRVQPARDDPAGRPARHRGAHVRVHRAGGGEGVGRLLLRADPVRRVHPGRLRGQPELRRRAADDAAQGRGDGDRARHRRRALLRLLARALLRVRRPPARHHERVGRVPGAPCRVRLRARDHQRGRRPAWESRSSSRASARCAGRSGRPSRSSSWSSATGRRASTR